jgi:uncharacterized protein (TIGR00730 family)
MKSITVFCASRMGNEDLFQSQATLLGETLAKQQIDLIYGGANVGLMGAVANGALKEGGKVIGVLPKFLESKEIAHQELTELIIVDNMHERKTIMHDLCDGIISLPGGLGTLEELFEMVTWSQLGLHKKPVGLLNIGGYYDPLIQMIQTMVDKDFLKESDQNILIVSDNVDDLLNQMKKT